MPTSGAASASASALQRDALTVVVGALATSVQHPLGLDGDLGPKRIERAFQHDVTKCADHIDLLCVSFTTTIFRHRLARLVAAHIPATVVDFQHILVDGPC